MDMMRAGWPISLFQASRWVHVGNRESDIYELYCVYEKLGTGFLVRSCVDRLAEDGGITVSWGKAGQSEGIPAPPLHLGAEHGVVRSGIGCQPVEQPADPATRVDGMCPASDTVRLTAASASAASALSQSSRRTWNIEVCANIRLVPSFGDRVYLI